MPGRIDRTRMYRQGTWFDMTVLYSEDNVEQDWVLMSECSIRWGRTMSLIAWWTALQRDLEGDAGPRPKFENVEVDVSPRDRQTTTDDVRVFQHGLCLRVGQVPAANMVGG